MDNQSDMKALYIIVNAGFADEVAKLVREAGAGGATIINARGTDVMHKSILGITVDTEKEFVLTIVDAATADNIIAAVKEHAGLHSPAHGVCLVMPVDRFSRE